MRTMGSIVAIGLALGACAAGTPPADYQAGTQPDSEVVGSATKAESQKTHGGDMAVSVVGTPFLWVFKGVACVATMAIAAPAGAVLALRPDIYRQEAPFLGDAVASNCGSPWVLTPPPETG